MCHLSMKLSDTLLPGQYKIAQRVVKVTKTLNLKVRQLFLLHAHMKRAKELYYKVSHFCKILKIHKPVRDGPFDIRGGGLGFF